MKIAGRILTGRTNVAFAVAALSLAIAGFDYLRDSAGGAFVDRVASATLLEQAEDMSSAYEGKLVWTTGMPTPSNSVRDREFNVDLPLLRLVRDSEIFQWREDSRKHRRYSVDWFEHGVDSRYFRDEVGHENTGSITFPDFTAEPREISMGTVKLD